jgi:hypothetical protein
MSIRGVTVGAAFCALVACGGANPQGPAAPSPKPGPPGTPPVLASSHPGTRNPRCATCHTLPVAGHTAIDVSQCAACHGGNGACNPNGRSTVRRHATSDDCVSCHQQHHAFTKNSECVACHFAPQGTRMCGSSGGGLGETLTQGCFGWPATEFSPSNKAAVQTFIQAGSKAVGFALRDVNGTSYTLSGLLAGKPVLLVHGAFT